MPQQYENYWKLTLEYSDIYDANFNNCLSIIVAFIDTNMYLLKTNPSEAYLKLQSELEQTFPKSDSGSTRKSINQFIKLGFLSPGLTAYHQDTKTFLSTTEHLQKRTIFSKIVYSNSSFSRSFTHSSDVHEINFLIKTLEDVGQLEKADVAALMTVDIEDIGQDSLDANQLRRVREVAEQDNFLERKYNQVNYLWNVLKKLDGLAIQNDILYLETDERVVSDFVETKTRKNRDPYLQKLYKNQLAHESQELFGGIVCMMEQLDYPVLIASHLKPYIQCDEHEMFDAENGLLLSRSMDQLFDKGYISFSSDGTVLVSRTRGLSNKLVDHLSKYKLDDRLLTENRQSYLQYHREKVFLP